MPLAMARPGTTVVITNIALPQETCTRLKTMGIFRGTALKVISSEYCGPMVVLHRGSQIALGQNLVAHILVETHKENPL